jgi:uncharacterized protein (UPF0548 family)
MRINEMLVMSDDSESAVMTHILPHSQMAGPISGPALPGHILQQTPFSLTA